VLSVIVIASKNNCYSTVVVVTRLWVGWSRVWILVPENFSSSAKRSE